MKTPKKLGLVLLIFGWLWSSSLVWGLSFKKKTILVGDEKIMVELAESHAQLEHGLMFRRELKADTGMLFIFSDEQPRSFWMKNTFIPLSIGFFDHDKKLIDMQEMLPVKSEMEVNPPTYQSAGAAKYALEMPAGWFNKKKIKIGAMLAY